MYAAKTPITTEYRNHCASWPPIFGAPFGRAVMKPMGPASILATKSGSPICLWLSGFGNTYSPGGIWNGRSASITPSSLGSLAKSLL